MFYIISGERSGQCYRYAYADNTYKWLVVEDADVAKAIADAAKAQAVADGKATVYTGTAIPASPQEGDIWMKSAKDGILTYVEDAWIEYNKYTELANNAQELAEEAKGESEQALEDAKKALDDAIAAHNEVQNSVNQIDIEYYLSTSATKLEGGEWLTTAPAWVDGKYIWSRQKISYVNSTKEPTYGDPACITGGKGATGATGNTTYFHIKYAPVENPTDDQLSDTPDTYIGTYVDFTATASTSASKYTWSKFQGKDGTNGTPGQNGTNGETSYLHIAYANSSDGKTDFSTTDANNKKYMGQYVDFFITDSTEPSDYKWTLIKGADGGKGSDGRGIQSTDIKYYVSDSGTIAPADSLDWTSSIPTVAQGKYLWTRTWITYTDTTFSKSYSVSRAATDGTSGVGIKSIVNKYALTTDTTAPSKTSTSWKDTPQTITSTNKYLWNYEIVTYTNNATSETTPHIIGAYGDKGTDGGNGTDGKGIVSITEHFQVGTSNTTAPAETTTWPTTPQTMTSTNKYLWSYEVITYTTGNPTTTAKRVIGTYGEKGDNGTSVTISSTEIKYQTSSSGTVVPTDETKWTTTIPSVSAGQYL